MVDKSDSSTRQSFLLALRSSNNENLWTVFVETYAPFCLYWCGRWGATPEDAEDVVQEVLLIVFKSIESFQFDPNGSFRGWLKVIAWRCWNLINEKQQRSLDKNLPILSALVINDTALNCQARDELISYFDKMAEAEILELAMSIVKAKVEAKTWEIFDRTELQNQAKNVVALEMKVPVGHVYAAAYRVRKLIHQEVRRIDPPSDENTKANNDPIVTK